MHRQRADARASFRARERTSRSRMTPGRANAADALISASTSRGSQAARRQDACPMKHVADDAGIWNRSYGAYVTCAKCCGTHADIALTVHEFIKKLSGGFEFRTNICRNADIAELELTACVNKCHVGLL